MRPIKENIFSVEKLIRHSPASSALRFVFFSQSLDDFKSFLLKVNEKLNYICRHSSQDLKVLGFSGDGKIKEWDLNLNQEVGIG